MDSARPRIVVLGGPSPGMKESMPFFTRGKHHPIFPLPVKCLSFDNAQQINRLQAFIQRIIEENLDLQAMQDRIWHSHFISQFSGAYWAVFLGKIPGIYTEWEGPDNAATQLNVTNSRFAASSEFTTLRGALIYMVSKGTNFRGDEDPDYYTSTYDPQAHTFPTPSRSSGQTRATTTPSHSSGQTRSAVLRTPSPTKPKVSAQTRLAISRTPSPTKPNVSGQTRLAVARTPAPNLTSLQADFTNISLDSSTLDQSLPDFFFYQHVRSLSEILDTVQSPILPAVEYTISFGEVIDSYLRSHGYNQEAIVTLEQAWVSSQGQRSNFIRYVCFDGLPRAEAEWIWDYIVKPSAQ
ncbi:hypothetical protein C0993_010076 [Termitomyces sp. T159_Od127]|nr:hypothetical protein C0993_010076 [Termitomyces sp. T159_Od127]